VRTFIKIIFLILFIFIQNGKVTAKNIKTQSNPGLSKLQAEKQKEKLFDDHRSYILDSRKKEMDERHIIIEDMEIKFDLKIFGNKPKTGWDLYFSLHGGGGVADSVNESLWHRHKTLYELKEGILLTPRSPSNTWDMWHQKQVDVLLNRLIQNMITFYNVNPNRIFIMGYSAGGDGVYQLAPRMADRFAAAAMMAGHPNETSPLGLRNIGFTIHMGENDSAYDRNKVALQWKSQLQELKDGDPNAYPHLVTIHENKGHWMGGLDTAGISWISRFTRNPFPRKVVWKQDDVTHNRFYWLKVTDPSTDDLIVASINDQVIDIEETNVSEIIITLNDHLVDMDENVMVKYLGNEIFNGTVARNYNTMARSMEEYGDPESVYFGEIPITLNLVD
jgi:predicted esterase